MTGSTSLARPQAQPQELAQVKQLTLEMVCELTGYSPLQISLISNTVAKDAPLLELAQFVHACKTLQLDPLLRQAYWIRRKNRVKVGPGPDDWADEWKGTLQVGIDGFRSLADRQGNYAGAEPPSFRDFKEISIEQWVGSGRDRRKELVKLLVPGLARVTSWKIVQGRTCAFTGEARWDEFYPGAAQGQMWHKMPHHQLAKCAEGQSLRKGWPAVLGSLNLDTAGGDGAAADDSAAPQYLIEEQPQVSERERVAVNAAKYDKYIASNYDDEPRRPEPEPTGPEPETEQEDPPVDSGKAALLGRNAQLVAEARTAGIKGLAPFTCNTTWPNDTIEAANKELYGRVAARNGDAEVARTAEATR